MPVQTITSIDEFTHIIDTQSNPRKIRLEIGIYGVPFEKIITLAHYVGSGKCPPDLEVTFNKYNKYSKLPPVIYPNQGAKIPDDDLKAIKERTKEQTNKENEFVNQIVLVLSNTLKFGNYPTDLVLGFHGFSLTNEGIQYLANILKVGKHLSGLDLTDTQFEGKIDHLAEALESYECPDGLVLNLSNTQLTPTELRVLASALQNKQSPFKKLTLIFHHNTGCAISHNCDDNSGIAAFSDLIASKNCPIDFMLDFADCNLNDDEIILLINSLQAKKNDKANRKLTLRLSTETNLDLEKAATAVATALKHENCPSNLTLDISDSQIISYPMPLISALQHCPPNLTLNFSDGYIDNNLSDAAEKALITILKNNTFSTGLTLLNLNINIQSLNELASALVYQPSSKKLTLSFDKDFDSECLINFLNGWEKELAQKNNYWPLGLQLDFSNASIKHQGIRALANILYHGYYPSNITLKLPSDSSYYEINKSDIRYLVNSFKRPYCSHKITLDLTGLIPYLKCDTLIKLILSDQCSPNLQLTDESQLLGQFVFNASSNNALQNNIKLFNTRNAQPIPNLDYTKLFEKIVQQIAVSIRTLSDYVASNHLDPLGEFYQSYLDSIMHNLPLNISSENYDTYYENLNDLPAILQHWQNTIETLSANLSNLLLKSFRQSLAQGYIQLASAYYTAFDADFIVNKNHPIDHRETALNRLATKVLLLKKAESVSPNITFNTDEKFLKELLLALGNEKSNIDNLSKIQYPEKHAHYRQAIQLIIAADINLFGDAQAFDTFPQPQFAAFSPDGSKMNITHPTTKKITTFQFFSTFNRQTTNDDGSVRQVMEI